MHDILCTNACDFYYYVASTRSQPAVLLVYSASWHNGLWHHSLSANAMATLQIRKWEWVHYKVNVHTIYVYLVMSATYPSLSGLALGLDTGSSESRTTSVWCTVQPSHTHTHTHTHTQTLKSRVLLTYVLSHGEPKANGNGCIKFKPTAERPARRPKLVHIGQVDTSPDALRTLAVDKGTTHDWTTCHA